MLKSSWYQYTKIMAIFERVDRPCRAVLVYHECSNCRCTNYYVRVDLADRTCEYPMLIDSKFLGRKVLAWDTPWKVPKYAVQLAWKAFRLKEKLEQEIV